MPLPLMVRIDDELAEQLREEASRTHAPMNRIINDALKARYSSAIESGGVSTPHIVATFGERIRQTRDAFKARQHQENQDDYRAADDEFGRLLLDCITALMVAHDPTIAPKVSPLGHSDASAPLSQEVHA